MTYTPHCDPDALVCEQCRGRVSVDDAMPVRYPEWGIDHNHNAPAREKLATFLRDLDERLGRAHMEPPERLYHRVTRWVGGGMGLIGGGHSVDHLCGPLVEQSALDVFLKRIGAE